MIIVMKKRIVLLAIFIFFILFGCKMKNKMIDNKSNLDDLITISRIRKTDFFTMCKTDNVYNLTLSQIADKYTISFLRKSQNDNYYTIWYNDTNRLFVVCVFEKERNDYHVVDFWEMDTFVDMDSFSTITVGETEMEYVESLFPLEYHYDGRDTGHGPTSIIHLTNGGIITIYYNYSFIVEKIQYDYDSEIIGENDVQCIKSMMTKNGLVRKSISG